MGLITKIIMPNVIIAMLTFLQTNSATSVLAFLDSVNANNNVNNHCSLSSSFASIKSCKFFHHCSIAETYTRHIMYRAWRIWSQYPKANKLHQFRALRGTRWHAEVKGDGNGLGWCKKLPLHDEPSPPKLLPLCNYRDGCPRNSRDALTTSRLGLIKKELETRIVIKEKQSITCQELGNKSIMSRKVFRA